MALTRLFTTICILINFFHFPYISAQNSLDDLNVYFQHDFERNTLGTYLRSEWGEDWLYPPYSSGLVPAEIKQDTKNSENPTKVMQWNFPEGSLGPSEGGGQWETSLETSYEEIYFSYDVLFMPGFDFALGGKIPGLRGGPMSSDKPAWDEGFTASMMFKQEGRLVFYTYNQDQELQQAGDSWNWGVYVTPGKWHNITIRVVMNSIGSVEGNNDGIMEGFFDGKLVCTRSNMHFRNIASIATDAMKVYSHFGGGTDEWRNSKDQYIQVDNFILYTFKDHMNVPRGRTVSPAGRTINYWRKLSSGNIIEPPSAPSQLKVNDFTDQDISISWKDNSNNENGFIIERSLATDPEQTTLIYVSENDTSYADHDLTPSTTYVYKVMAVNSSGNISESSQNFASTLSHAETQRIKEGLVAYYNFNFSPDGIIRDMSQYGNPLNLRIVQPSAVTWKNHDNLDILSGTAIVSIKPATKIVLAVKNTEEITVECWVKPFEENLFLNSRIMSLGNNDSETGFVLDQNFMHSGEKDEFNYGIRLQTESTNKSGFPELISNITMDYINIRHLTYVRDKMGKEAFYVNGEMVAEGFRPSNFNSWDDNFYLRIANESSMNLPWSGTLYSAAIYNRALSLSEITKNYSVGPSDDMFNNGIDYSLEIYPNPLQESATITITPEEYKDFVPQTIIRILDMHGKVYHQEVLFNPNNQFIKTLNFKDFPKGIYHLQVISGNHKKSTKLVLY